MEITLEKIELVKDRTGVTYKEAKEALEAADGNVVDAIIAIEDTVDEEAESTVAAKKDALMTKIKEVVKKGNVSKIVIKKDGDKIINIPLTVGILGTVVAPWGAIAGAIAAFGFKCSIEFVKDDGTIISLSDKAEDAYEDVKEKGAEVYSDLKEKAPGVYEDIKEKGGDALEKAKHAANSAKDKIKKNDEDEDIIIDICDKDCEDCSEPCEDPCDDCEFDKYHKEPCTCEEENEYCKCGEKEEACDCEAEEAEKEE